MIQETVAPHPELELKQDRYLQELLRFIRSRDVFVGGDKVLVAISGGLDSTVLGHLMSRLARLIGIQVEFVHVDHKTRGMASEKEGVWVRVLGERLGIHTHHLSLEETVYKSSQAAMRDRRRAALLSLAGKIGATKIATAHHADDNAETFIMRAMAGSGARGIAGMSPLEGLWAKPLLWASRIDIETYARELRLGWVEDPSNERNQYLRNRIRQEVLPILEDVRQGSIRNLSRLAARLEQEEEEWKSWLQTQFEGNKELLPLAWLEKYPRPLKRRILTVWLERLNLESQPQLVESLLAGEELVHPQGSFLRRSDTLIFTREAPFGQSWEAPLSLELGKRVNLGKSMAWGFLFNQEERFRIQEMFFMMNFRRPEEEYYNAQRLAWDRLPWPLILRTRLPEETWMDSYFKQAKIPRPYWKKWPLIVAQHNPSQVIALLGVKVNEPYEPKMGERTLAIECFFEDCLNTLLLPC